MYWEWGFSFKEALSDIGVGGACPWQVVLEYRGEVEATLSKGGVSLGYL